jgi:class 3 adenylate cyclase
LLRAINELTSREKDAPKAAVATAASGADTAERCQVIVMFSDLVGSTALSARMNPEDLREVISAYQKCVAEIMQRFGGFVAKYMGDGVLVYFGYPQAREDDAERAVRAGLELVPAVDVLKSGAPLQTRPPLGSINERVLVLKDRPYPLSTNSEIYCQPVSGQMRMDFFLRQTAARAA